MGVQVLLEGKSIYQSHFRACEMNRTTANTEREQKTRTSFRHSVEALTTESLVAGLFLVVAVVGFKKNLWLVVAALAGHGVFDLFHHLFIENPGVPVWWPGFCLGFDILASGVLAALLMSRSGFAHTLTSKN